MGSALAKPIILVMNRWVSLRSTHRFIYAEEGGAKRRVRVERLQENIQD
jgi:hypothetical protein